MVVRDHLQYFKHNHQPVLCGTELNLPALSNKYVTTTSGETIEYGTRRYSMRMHGQIPTFTNQHSVLASYLGANKRPVRSVLVFLPFVLLFLSFHTLLSAFAQTRLHSPTTNHQPHPTFTIQTPFKSKSSTKSITCTCMAIFHIISHVN